VGSEKWEVRSEKWDPGTESPEWRGGRAGARTYLGGGGWQAHFVRRESCDCSQQSRAFGCLNGGDDCLLGGASTEPRDPGLGRRAGRRTSCAGRAVMAHSSPEPAALLFGGDDCLLGGASTEPRDPGLGRRAGRRTPCAGRAVMAHSSPEPAALLFGGDDCLLGGASTEPRGPGLGRRAGRRTSCAGESCDGSQRVQSLRRAGGEGAMRVGWREYGASRSRGWSEGWQAHSVRRESCDCSQQSRACGCLNGEGRDVGPLYFRGRGCGL
jgi:hypothetical protein